jgi:RNA polymerase sigma factor (TIGR02999 family)
MPEADKIRRKHGESMDDIAGDVTLLLRRWGGGDSRALDELIPIVYSELRRLANYYLQQEGHAQTLQSTALVHELYLRLCRQQEPNLESRAHFFAVAAQMIRRLLVDHARERSAIKRGGGKQAGLEEAVTIPVHPNLDILALDESLSALASQDARKSRIVEMRFFGGLSALEIARVLGMSEATVRRDWSLARAWLFRHMEGRATT